MKQLPFPTCILSKVKNMKTQKWLPSIKMKSVSLFILTALATFAAAPGLMGQTTIHIAQAPFAPVQVPRVQLNLSPQLRTTALVPILGMAGLPAGPSQAPYPVRRTLANDALVRSNAWAAYNASVHPNAGPQAAQTPAAAENPNRLAARQNLLDQDRFIQMPQSSGRYNFQFSDNEIRSVQAALRRLGLYSGQVDGILGPETRRAVEDYQAKNKLPVTGQPDQTLNALLGIF
jgi:hypothetical protein